MRRGGFLAAIGAVGAAAALPLPAAAAAESIEGINNTILITGPSEAVSLGIGREEIYALAVSPMRFYRFGTVVLTDGTGIRSPTN